MQIIILVKVQNLKHKFPSVSEYLCDNSETKT